MAVTSFGLHAHGFDGADTAEALAVLRTLVTNDSEPVVLSAGKAQVRLPSKLVETLTELVGVIANKRSAAVFIVDKNRKLTIAETAKVLGLKYQRLCEPAGREILPMGASGQGVDLADMFDLTDATSAINASVCIEA